MPTLFISDLHLCATRPTISELFLEFLAGRARRSDALYILGDLFEYWIGDEASAQEEYRPVVSGLRDLTAAGVPVFIMHGNRDFLIGGNFARATGCRLLSEPARIDLYGTPTLLMHGDVLCTADVEYMAFRALVRSDGWQKTFLAKTPRERDAVVRDYRERSKVSTANKPLEIMDVTQAAVESAMRDHKVRHLIHGHTHRPAEHAFVLDGTPARRWVLGDWYEQGSVLQCEPRAWVLERLTPPARDKTRQRPRSS